MKILHCCLAGGYTERCAYQENMLTELHRAHGHDVLVAASTESVTGGRFVNLPAGDDVTASGIKIKRLPYADYVPGPLKNKIRVFPGFEGVIEDYRPDVIFFHSVASHELLTAARYKKNNPDTALLVDSHAALSNSARSFISKQFQHKLYYRSLYRRTHRYIDRLFYIGMEEKDYLTDVLGISERNIEFLPLGGLIFDGAFKNSVRERVRGELGLSEDDLVLCHSGKLSALKRTEVLLGAMRMINDRRVKLLIIGKAEGAIMDSINEAAAADDRIRFLGWATADRLRECLCASDIYAQPGDVSATMQNALCCGVPAVALGIETYRRQFGDDSGVIFLNDKTFSGTRKELDEQLSDEQTESDILAFVRIIGDVLSGGLPLDVLGENARSYAAQHLDYEAQARMIESMSKA